MAMAFSTACTTANNSASKAKCTPRGAKKQAKTRDTWSCKIAPHAAWPLAKAAGWKCDLISWLVFFCYNLFALKKSIMLQ